MYFEKNIKIKLPFDFLGKINGNLFGKYDMKDQKFFLSFESRGLATNLPIELEAKVNEYLSLIMKLIFAFCFF